MLYSKGVSVLAMELPARSAIRRVMSRSNGCKSATCRFPVRRRMANTNRYMKIARKNSVSIGKVCAVARGGMRGGNENHRNSMIAS